MAIIGLVALAMLSSCASRKDFDAVGYFEAKEITVSAEVTGRITSFHIAEGDTLNPGESVGSIDTTQYYLNKMLLEKNVKSVSSNRPNVSVQTAALQSQLDNLKKEKVRIEKLVNAKAAPSKQLDDINASIASLQSQMRAQKLTLSNNAQSIDAQSSALDIQKALVEDQLTKCRLLAPVGGTVLATYVEPGEFATVGKPLYKVADLSDMTLRAYATSDQLADLKVGQTVKVKAVFGDKNIREYEGRISNIASKSEFTPKNIPTNNERADMVYALKILVPNDGFIKIGTYAEVLF